jgi:hypothetical protein
MFPIIDSNPTRFTIFCFKISDKYFRIFWWADISAIRIFNLSFSSIICWFSQTIPSELNDLEDSTFSFWCLRLNNLGKFL